MNININVLYKFNYSKKKKKKKKKKKNKNKNYPTDIHGTVGDTPNEKICALNGIFAISLSDPISQIRTVRSKLPVTNLPSGVKAQHVTLSV